MKCAIIMEPVDEVWLWHCKTCDAQGEPADIITAYWGGLVHEEEARGRDDKGA